MKLKCTRFVIGFEAEKEGNVPKLNLDLDILSALCLLFYLRNAWNCMTTGTESLDI